MSEVSVYRDEIVDRIEVRVLGPLRVRRADGSLVDAKEWRTGKTSDLLRLLATRAGQAVSVDVLLDALWPEVDETKGRASLRTAASQIRRVLAQDCIERRPTGLALTDAWVDAVAFSSLAAEARRLVHQGQLAAAVKTTREAESLYLGELQAHMGDADWVVAEREALAKAYRQLLVDAADAAVQLGWMRDAVEFASRVLAIDPVSERAYRALMRGYAGLGETARALTEYERCREALADQLGADPSPQTAAVHMQVLTAEEVQAPEPPLTGLEKERDWLHTTIATALDAGEPAVVLLCGPPGAGKTRLLHEAARSVEARRVILRCPADGGPPECLEQLRVALGVPGGSAAELQQAAASTKPLILTLDDAECASPESVGTLVAALADLAGPIAVVLAADIGGPDDDPFADVVRTEARRLPRRLFRLELPSLAEEDVARLAGELLADDASPQLVHAICTASSGAAGRVVQTVRSWLHDGRIASTADGLILMPSRADSSVQSAAQRLGPVLEQLTEADVELLSLVAIIEPPVSPAVLLPLLGATSAAAAEQMRGQVKASLDGLVDRAMLTLERGGYEFRDPSLRAAMQSWLRPTARRELHRRVAEAGPVPSSQRVEHWLLAGEPELARAAALGASAEAMADGRCEDARAHLVQVCSLGAMPETLPSDRVELFERLADVCALLGRRDEVHAALSVAISVARSAGLPEVDRLVAKLERLESGDPIDGPSTADLVVVEPLTGAAPGEPDPSDDVPPLDLDVSADVDAEHRWRQELEEADRHNDTAGRVRTRLALAEAICLPRRQFGLGRLWAQEVLAISVLPRLRARAVLASWVPSALLGAAQLAEQPMQMAGELAGQAADDALDRRCAVLNALIAHDLGRPEFPALWARAAEACTDASDGYWSGLMIRIATERGDLDTAQAVAEGPDEPHGSSGAQRLRDLAVAVLHAELGRTAEAVEALQDLIEAEVSNGSQLLLPEAAARLIILESETDLAAAKEHFDLLDWAAGGDHGFARENCLRLLARAAIRAASGSADSAAGAAANAADVAESSGLTVLAAQAHQTRAKYLSQAGRWSEARLAEAAASRLRTAAGISATNRPERPTWHRRPTSIDLRRSVFVGTGPAVTS